GTPGAVRERLYFECARFHPEIKERDRAALVAAGLREPPPSPTPLAPQQLGQQGARRAAGTTTRSCRSPGWWTAATPRRRGGTPRRRAGTPRRRGSGTWRRRGGTRRLRGGAPSQPR
ncbi:unnamed protein product, partial [Prorocentrum cordatum]